MDLGSWAVLFCSGFVTEFHYHLIVPSLYLIGRGLGRRSAIKTDLKNAVDYCRVRTSYARTIISMVITIGAVVGMNYLTDYLPNSYSFPFLYLAPPLTVHYIFQYRLQNFTTGIRWYVSGIKLPGERSLLIPWRHISEVRIDDGFIYLNALGKQHKLDINPDDYRSALHFVRWFEKKKAANPA